MARAKDRKGVFGAPRLPVARRYPRIPSRRPLLILGGIAVACVLAFVLWDAVVGDAGFVSNGALSSAHANLEENCGACHTTLAGLQGKSGLSSESCSVCHEKHGDEIGVYTFVSHYLYRSNDIERQVPSNLETTCQGCHPEHLGREAPLTAVSDAQCVSCHASIHVAKPIASFDSGHPDFDVAITELAESALHFPHIQHVREVMSELREKNGDERPVYIEQACLYCHNGQEDGRGFEPISFDLHCDRCHLSAGTRTEWLPIASGDSIGVESIEGIQKRRPPGSNWALFANELETEETLEEPEEDCPRAPCLFKRPLHHRDPWLLWNLRRLRQRLYPEEGLADLLVASPDAAPHQTVVLYREAIATLRQRALELRSEPDAGLQNQLRKIEVLLSQAERKLGNPLTPLDGTRFSTAFLEKNPALAADKLNEIDSLVTKLVEPCAECHVVEKATIRRVAADQRTLHRAEFNHRAHIVQLGCLDCHRKIPFAEHLESTEAIAARLDSAEIVNLPAIESCRECHNPKQSTNRCTSCHLFHSDSSRHSELLLYLDEP